MTTEELKSHIFGKRRAEMAYLWPKEGKNGVFMAKKGHNRGIIGDNEGVVRAVNVKNQV